MHTVYKYALLFIISPFQNILSIYTLLQYFFSVCLHIVEWQYFCDMKLSIHYNNKFVIIIKRYELLCVVFLISTLCTFQKKKFSNHNYIFLTKSILITDASRGFDSRRRHQLVAVRRHRASRGGVCYGRRQLHV